jgi:hypothetical protein
MIRTGLLIEASARLIRAVVLFARAVTVPSEDEQSSTIIGTVDRRDLVSAE